MRFQLGVKTRKTVPVAQGATAVRTAVKAAIRFSYQLQAAPALRFPVNIGES